MESVIVVISTFGFCFEMQQAKYGCLELYKYEYHCVWSKSSASKHLVDSKHLSWWMSYNVNYVYILFTVEYVYCYFLFPSASVRKGGRGVMMKTVYYESFL